MRIKSPSQRRLLDNLHTGRPMTHGLNANILHTLASLRARGLLTDNNQLTEKAKGVMMDG